MGERSPASRQRPAEIRAELESRGVSPAVSGPVAERLRSRLEIRVDSDATPEVSSADSYELLLDGVAEALLVLDADTPAEPDLQEIERLMAAFVGELSKLDEVLEVLSAHVERMRLARPEPGSLH